MDFQKLRNEMVDGQIKARGITDAAVLEVLRRVPRHEFVLKETTGRAYNDYPISIGEGQTISQPYIVALMTQCLDLNRNKRALEIGTGSGYQTAILAELCREVLSIERIEVLVQRARQTLRRLDYSNIKIFLGDGSLGLPDELKPFDAIIVTAASPDRPDDLLSQLAPEGRLVVPIGDRFGQRLTLFTKTKDKIVEEVVCGCTFVPLIGKYGWAS